MQYCTKPWKILWGLHILTRTFFFLFQCLQQSCSGSQPRRQTQKKTVVNKYVTNTRQDSCRLINITSWMIFFPITRWNLPNCTSRNNRDVCVHCCVILWNVYQDILHEFGNSLFAYFTTVIEKLDGKGLRLQLNCLFRQIISFRRSQDL